MGSNSEISKILLDSCHNLHKDDILNDNMLDLCKESIDDNYVDLDLTEQNIFGSKRDDKIDKFDYFLKDLKKIKDYINKGNQNNAEIRKAKNELNKFIKYLSYYINKKLLERHNNRESIHYEQLKNNYVNIENNRNKLNELNKIKDGMDLKLQIEKDKLNKSSNIFRNIFLFCVIIFLVIIIITIYIKFYKI